MATSLGPQQTPDVVTLEDIEHDELIPSSISSNTSRTSVIAPPALTAAPPPPSSPTSSTPSPVSAQSELDSDREISYEELKFPPPPPPKHIPFPEMPQTSEIFNELVMFVYTSLAASMQFLHLYRTVWWLPDSHTSHALVNVKKVPRIQLYWFFYFAELLPNRHVAGGFYRCFAQQKICVLSFGANHLLGFPQDLH